MQCIQDQSHRFKIYVASRVFQILGNTSSNDWNFIQGVKNPADVCSRGVFHPTQLLETDKHGRNWLYGPEYLHDNNFVQYSLNSVDQD